MGKHMQKRKRSGRQAGGTFLGLILGLIIGLSIAVVVAVMIMKTPIPFTNKQARAERAAEPAGVVGDPNQPLYGKRDAVKAVVPETAPPPNTVQAPESRAPIVEHPVAEPQKPVKGESKNEPKADGGQWIYYLQAGAFRSQADAESTRAKLALLGFEAQISERQSDQGTLYRVRLGPFAQQEAMNRVRGKLSDNGIDAAVVRTPK